jgi:LysR family transcriptional regulator, glycine cleavage system transcriptional activator
MSYRLPSLNGLRAFEASARHLSFKRASDELCVTPGAVSQQVKSLEASLGVTLFRRFPRGLLLTTQGETYLPMISNAFRAISEATDTVAPVRRDRELRVGISPKLSRRHPAIENLRRTDASTGVRLLATDDLRKLLDGQVDMLLRASLQSPPGLHIDRIEAGESAATAMALVTLPGLAGCREHRALLKLLRQG